VVHQRHEDTNAPTDVLVTATCPAVKSVLGGETLRISTTGWDLVSSWPGAQQHGDQPNTWNAHWQSSVSGNYFLADVYAICAPTQP